MPYRTMMPRGPTAATGRRDRHGGAGAAGDRQTGPQGRGPAAGVADRQRQRVPAGQPAQLGRREGRPESVASIGPGCPADAGPSRRTCDDQVGGVDDPFQPVLGHHHGDPQVVDETGDGGQDLLGRRDRAPRSVRRAPGCRGCGGQHRADGHPLLLAARRAVSGRWRSSAEVQEVEVSSTRARMAAAGRPRFSML